MELNNGIATFYAKTRKDWRKWLMKNHKASQSVCLILYHKASTTPGIYYDEAVEEALCFGWIDTKANKRDEESFYLLLTPRKPKSNWSKANRERVTKLVEQGLMTPAGQAVIDRAKETGTWTALEKVQQLTILDDLMKLFNKNKKAFKNFEAFAPSSRRIILEWILNAKRPGTRTDRLTKTVALAAENIKANHRQS